MRFVRPVVALAREHWLLSVLLAIGLLLRVAMMVALPLPLMNFTDANVYVDAAREFLFRPQMGRTAGYPLMLRVMHVVWESPTLPVIVQHASALAAAVGLYAIGRVADVPRALAAVAAGVWFVSIDWIWLEHQLMTETMGTVLAVAALAVFALAPARTEGGMRLAVAAGVLAGGLAIAAAITRPGLFPAFPGIGLAALLLLRVPWRARAVSAAVLVATCGALLWGYLQVQDAKTGFGNRIVGAELDLGRYPTVGPIADCDEFEPPPETESLCEDVPVEQRPTSDNYYWDPNTPGRALLAARPDLNDEIKEWAERSYRAQKDDVREERLMAFERLFGTGGFIRPAGDQGPQIFELEGADAGAAGVVVTAIQAYYGTEDAPNAPADAPYGLLEDLQEPTRPPGILFLAALVLTAVGVLLGRGRARALALTMAVAGWLPILYSLWAAGFFNWRYVLPGIPFVTLAAMAAVAALLARRRAPGEA